MMPLFTVVYYVIEYSGYFFSFSKQHFKIYVFLFHNENELGQKLPVVGADSEYPGHPQSRLKNIGQKLYIDKVG